MPGIKKKITVRKKRSELTIDVYSPEGKVLESIKLNENIFGITVSRNLLAQAVKIHLNNQRAGTHLAKSRSLVRGSTRKIYRQKGTGRARHGSIRAPIFVGGGIAHGPKIRDYSLNFPKNMRRKAIIGALSEQFHQNNLLIIAGLKSLPLKTKELISVFKNLQLINGKKKVKAVYLITDIYNKNLYLSGRNIDYLTISQAYNLNTYDVLRSQKIILMKEALVQLEKLLLSAKKVSKNPLKPERKTSVTKTGKKITTAVRKKQKKSKK